jgi:molecular chaperone GrpE
MAPAADRSSRATEAAARVADMLADEDAEQVEEAEDAVGEDIEELVSGAKLAAAEAARDEYLDSLRRLQADFENYKKRIQRQQIDLKERAAEDLVVKLLPVLDNFDLAIAHAEQNVEPIYRSLLEILGTAGLERIDPANQPFDPNEHDAVLHEEGEGSDAPEVIEVLRAGYRWKGRVLRPAMVKVKG